MKSEFLKLNFKDLLTGLAYAVGSALIAYFVGVVQSGDFTQVNWNVVGTTAFSATVFYLSKKLTTNSDGEPLKTEEKTELK